MAPRSTLPARPRRLTPLLALALTAALAASCTDAEDPITPDALVARHAVAAADAEQAQVAALARSVALALDDAGLRQRVKQDMRRSPLREHKLKLDDYLHGNGGILLAKMAQRSGRSREELLGMLASVRPLEFYMPVAEHRESWTGGDDLLLAWRLEEDQAPGGFDLRGEPVALRADAPPATPTFVLVPVETNFAAPVDVTKTRNVNDKGGESIGTRSMILPEDECGANMETAIAPCTGETGGYTAPPAPAPAGIYFKEMVIYDNNEPWSSGSPEIEVHMRGLKKGVVRDVSTLPNFQWPSRPSTPTTPYSVPTLPPMNSLGSTPIPNMTGTRFYPDEYEWVFADCAGAQAPLSWARFDYNDEGGAHHYDTKVFAKESNFTLTEFVQTTQPPQIFRRETPLLPPFEIYIVERDDGHECPTAERKYRLDASVELNIGGGKILGLFDLKNLDGEDILYLLRGNNDPVARWWINSYAQLEALNQTWLPRRTDDTEIDDAILRVSNQGFSSTRLVPQSGY